MKALFGSFLNTRLPMVLGLLLALGFASCSKDEVMAPGGNVPCILKGGEGSGTDQGRVGGPMTNGTTEAGKESAPAPAGVLRGFDGEDLDGDGISDDGDDEGDNEKSNTKPRGS